MTTTLQTLFKNQISKFNKEFPLHPDFGDKDSEYYKSLRIDIRDFLRSCQSELLSHIRKEVEGMEPEEENKGDEISR